MNPNDTAKIQNDPRFPPLGTTISNCKLSSIVGIGGVAVIYKAFEVDLEMQRAIKVLKPDAIEFLRKKFETEAKVTARLDHPNIVKVHGSGIYDGRLPFIHMEFIDGKTLRSHLLAHHVLPAAVGISVIAIIASALEYAYGQSFSIWGNHSEKLVHRDLKPENILIANDGTLKVMDFGLAQFEDGKKQGGWGTPSYMSPEQLDHQKADLRNDLYSLGVMLYEMLCGTRPFSDNETECEQSKREGNYKPVSTHAPDVPNAIREIVDKCLKPNLEERYRTYESLRSFATKALSEITSRSPQETIKAFVTNPDEFHMIQHSLKSSNGRKTRLNSVPKIVLIGTITVLVLLSIAVVWYFLRPQLERTPHISSPTQADTIEHSINQTDTPHVSSTESTKRYSHHRAPDLLAKEKSSLKTAPTTKQIAQDANPVLSETVTLWKNKNYSAVIANITSMHLDTLAKPVQDSALIMLADAYYASRSIPEIIDLGSRHTVHDAHFYTICSFAHEIFQDFEAASLYIDKAVVAPIRFGSQSRNTLLFERAMFYKRHHESLGDEPSKNSMLEAFRRFLAEGCSTNSKNCEEAKKIVRAYE